ncbi:PREDICTED: uncharacterized protein LOC105366628 [Ceratosolen solmsi marchali]|uniref:Odorant receptor n=1 Tax=Ceratosolen solmsi marchali TaxID=326594 RepID=A0AAJ6YSI3_9HYME|nr:PREDICTED: uncharacterized protein LOC105366628 [Ceratosolen solmsi marchali]
MYKTRVNIGSIELDNLRNIKDFRYNLQITRWLLQLLGIWPIKSLFYENIQCLLFIIICIFLFMFLLIPSCLQAYFEKDAMVKLQNFKPYHERVMMIGPIIFFTMNTLNYGIILVKKHDIHACIIQIAIDWHKIKRIENKRIMLKNAKVARFFITLCIYFTFGGGMIYISVLPIVKNIIDSSSKNNLAFPSYFFFFNPQVRPMYDIVLGLQILSTFLMFAVVTSIFSIIINSIMHASSQCTIITAALKKFGTSGEEKPIKIIVKHHLRVLKFITKLENTLNYACFIELLGCTFNLIMLGYYLIIHFQNKNIWGIISITLLLISHGFNLLIFCFAGEHLTQKCENIGKVAYSINWYELCNSDKQNITFIMVISGRSIVLTAGKMTILSIYTFCNVMKAFVTYLNVLRTHIMNSS